VPDSGNGAGEVPGQDQDQGQDQDEGDHTEIIATLKELIETRIRPVTAQEGGDVSFHSYQEGVVYLELEGPVHGLMGPIGNMLRHYVPELKGVRDHTDLIAKPGLETPAGKAVRQILDEQINPAVAGHGGHIALVDVQDERVYVRLEGGCQGCGMANVTLKQGIETALRQAIPEITTVLDVTDHAGGTNPYYQPSQK
jgi:Fe-S cluster biogenesis protein NfuA